MSIPIVVRKPRPPLTKPRANQPSLNLNFEIDVPEDNSIAARQFSYMLCPSLPGKLMKISKDVDDLRFVADCDPELGFTPLDIECRHCGGRGFSNIFMRPCRKGVLVGSADARVYRRGLGRAAPKLRPCPQHRGEDLLKSRLPQITWLLRLYDVVGR
jgi:hypothetical protein